MNEEKTTAQQTNDTCFKEFSTTYSDKVHVIGRITMAIGFVLSFLPILYLNFVKGYAAPLSSYLLVASTIAVMRVGMWISEPFTWYPILGAASSYMSYFAGNAKNLRVPVAQNLQAKYDVEVNSPKGQIITTIGVGISVFVNLIILLVVVLAGNAIIHKLPWGVINSFNYVIPALIGSLLCNHLRRRGLKSVLIYSIPAVIVFVLMLNGLVQGKYANSISIGITVLAAYIAFVIRGKKEAAGAEK